MIELGNTGVAGQRIKALLEEQGIREPSVLAAMQNTPRNYFVEEALASQAWGNQALPIGAGQTISQPYIVARMTELLLQTKPNKFFVKGYGAR